LGVSEGDKTIFNRADRNEEFFRTRKIVLGHDVVAIIVVGFDKIALHKTEKF
jgi:hypothetical protein